MPEVADDRRGLAPRCGVVIPARDEESTIGRCLAALLDGLPAGYARIVVACNGCRDGTAAAARRFAGPDLQVLDLPDGGKAGAIRAAERLLPDAPRVFLDADVEFRGADLVRLVESLSPGDLHLVSPAIEHDRAGCGTGAAAVSQVWLALPHARTSAFHHVLGVSAEGRRRWGEFPELIADDAFIASRFRPDERRVDGSMAVKVRPPRTLRAWIGVRGRWIRGDRQLRELGLASGQPEPQGRALAGLASRPSMLPGVLLYLAIRLAASVQALRTRGGSGSWYRDGTTRG